MQVRHGGHLFNKHVVRGTMVYWRCSQHQVFKCKARLKSDGSDFFIFNDTHCHEVVPAPRSYGSLKRLKQKLAQSV
ncbi:uncharacterized protein LOC120418380 [Culex pipiens pallens]|uniref:uncharacterized protein LOC120418380 n=1 Tax=Culex pipiens pallens TaxID=42434 RepID=UPI001954ED6D|nr:uncharacterized protein LOC120418380 [Culex pipiens pallens]XP_039436688.1 uncharacterized protein LOC120418380 [Culex pipiens pallens]